MSTRACTSCGHALPTEARYCGQCGHAAIPVACTYCGAPARDAAKFCVDCGKPLSAPLPAVRPATAEKRQATILNLDLVDSTSLTVQLDAEDSHRAVLESIQTIQEVVYRYKDRAYEHFDRIEGDSVMFCFGLPYASEDDAERAATAALEAAAAVNALGILPDVTLNVRAGIASGNIVVDFPVGARLTPEPFITGHAANLASRLRALAPVGGVVVAEETVRLIGHRFECEPLGTKQLKGIGKVSAWHLRSPLTRERLDALWRRLYTTPLVGREQDIGTILDRWALARAGTGQVAVISGAAGIGKSRVLAEVFGRVRDECPTPLHFQCSQHYRNSAFHPIAEHMQWWAGSDASLGPATRLRRLRRKMSRLMRLDDRTFEAVIRALSLDTAAAVPVAPADVRQARQMAIDSLVQLAQARASASAVTLIVLEDAQWADPSTLQVADAIVSRIAGWHALMIVTARSEFDVSRWSGDHVTHLPLQRLSEQQCQALVSKLSEPGTPLSDQARSWISARSDGVPFFVEELTKAAQECPEIVNGGHTADGAPAPIPLPVTLRELLTARLDRSHHAKAVAQAGAVIGREFDDALLAATLDDGAADRETGLADLRAVGLLYTRRVPGRTVHAFRHLLVRDFALESLLKGARRRLHAKVASVFEFRTITGEAVAPEIIAYHYTEAAMPQKAMHFWALAGYESMRRSANEEALHQLNQGLEALRLCPAGNDRTESELDLLSCLSRVLAAAKGYAAPDVATTFRRLRPLVDEAPMDSRVFMAHWLRIQHLIVGAEYRRALSQGIELAQDAAVFLNEDSAAAARLLVGVSHLYMGQIGIAMEHLSPFASGTYSCTDPREVPDVAAPALAYLARAAWLSGRFDLSRHYSEMADVASLGAQVPLAVTQTSGMRMILHQLRGDRSATRCSIDDTLAIATERDHRHWVQLAKVLDHWWHATPEDAASAAALESAIDDYRATGARVGLSTLYLLHAEVLAMADRASDALRVLDSAIAFCNETQERIVLAELHRKQAAVLLRADAEDSQQRAEPFLRMAIGLSQKQGALALQLRSAVDLAQLWARQGRCTEAADLLGAVYGRFTEGPDCPDLVRAREVLDSLSPASVG